MIPFLIQPAKRLKGSFCISSDKAITHRAIILSSISCGKTIIKNYSLSADCFYTLEIFKRLGVKIKRVKNKITIEAKGLLNPQSSQKPLFVGESGTTARIILGVLAGQKFSSKITASPALNKRPMKRVIKPLIMMGAKITATERNEDLYLPIKIEPSLLRGIEYKLEVPSAQVKSAILLASLYARGKTQIIEPIVSRDHTERMLKLFGADIKINKENKTRTILLNSENHLVSPREIVVPGDFSSAIFFIVAGLIVPNSNLIIKSVGLNPTRIGALRVLKRMRANIKIKNYRVESDEPVGDIIVRNLAGYRHACPLRATRIKREELPSLIDELPILMVACAKADGESIIEKAKELRVKETDRINSMVVNLKNMGVDIYVGSDDTIRIKGPVEFSSTKLKSFGDHRTAMSLTIAALTADKPSSLDDISCTSKSFPEFRSILKKILTY